MWINRVGALIGAAVAVSGCNTVTGPGSGERHGKDIASAASWPRIRWGTSGDLVTFVSADARTVLAHHLASGVTQSLFTVGGEELYDVQFFRDAREFFTSSWKAFPDGMHTIVRRHTASGAVVLAGVVGVLVTRGQGSAAFRVWPESLYFAQRGEEPRLIGDGCVDLIAWSPDDTRVLCATGFHTTYGVFHLNGAPVESFTLPANVENSAISFHWDAGGIEVSYRTECCQLSLYNQTTGSSRGLLAPYGGGPERPTHHISWSSDGTRAAYWTHYCHSNNAVSCSIEEDYFYILDLASGATKRVAVHACQYKNAGAPDCDDAQVAISPTGSTIAYAINNRLFLLDVK